MKKLSRKKQFQAARNCDAKTPRRKEYFLFLKPLATLRLGARNGFGS
jgi:hypothetical protein